jgi:hypothetical protein
MLIYFSDGMGIWIGRLNGMLSASDRNIEVVIKSLAKFNLEAGYIVPTATGLSKSIFDAHSSFRRYLSTTKIHNYSRQKQGPQYKKLIPIKFVARSGVLIPMQLSLYRPVTKTGDPRVWVKGIKQYLKPGNLVALFKIGSELFVINTSDPLLWKTITKKNSPLYKLLENSINSFSSIENELLQKLRIIEKRKWITSKSSAPNSTKAIGHTLEKLLGIPPNSSPFPDYNGIEIKATNSGSSSAPTHGRFTLFGLAPNWKISPIKSEAELVDKYGYESVKHGAKALQVTVKHTSNNQNLYLDYNSKKDLLENNFKCGRTMQNMVNWELSSIKSALIQKHRKTFWVLANRRKNTKTGKFEFHYHTVIATSDPFLNNFTVLVLSDIISLDYVVKQKVNTQGKAIMNKNGFPTTRSHGINWKINQSQLSSLFPPPRTITL